MGHAARIFRRGLISLLALGVSVSLLATPAGARTCTKQIAPPGHAGSSQYFETVPTSCGNAAPPTGRGGSGSSINRLGSGHAGLRSLSHLGPAGQSAAALAAATAPGIGGTTSGSAGSTAGSGGASGGSGSPGASGGSAAQSGKHGQAAPSAKGLAGLLSGGGSSSSALGDALTGSGSGGLGILLPLLLAATLTAAVAAGIIRAARRPGP